MLTPASKQSWPGSAHRPPWVLPHDAGSAVLSPGGNPAAVHAASRAVAPAVTHPPGVNPAVAVAATTAATLPSTASHACHPAGADAIAPSDVGAVTIAGAPRVASAAQAVLCSSCPVDEIPFAQAYGVGHASTSAPASTRSCSARALNSRGATPGVHTTCRDRAPGPGSTHARPRAVHARGPCTGTPSPQMRFWLATHPGPVNSPGGTSSSDSTVRVMAAAGPVLPQHMALTLNTPVEATGSHVRCVTTALSTTGGPGGSAPGPPVGGGAAHTPLHSGPQNPGAHSTQYGGAHPRSHTHTSGAARVQHLPCPLHPEVTSPGVPSPGAGVVKAGAWP